ncbi:MAG: SDR family oxidoreductase [Rhizobiales bacterium]|jgi:3-oxoacyl-[acyl-carrier protein] reductase|nr:SDR family oxidoreductase [Hyphomicrobiales bacterium]
MSEDGQGRVAIVTGAAGTMGMAAAKRLAADNYKVALLDIAADRLSAVAKDLKGSLAIAGDISQPEKVNAAVGEVESKLGPASVLVNNAGILSNNKSAETTPEEWRRVIGVNLDAAFYLARAVLPGMKQRRYGRIVNVCSLAMKTGGLTAGTAYTTSKSAIGGLTFSLAREVAPFGVTVNGIAPAYVKTPMVSEQLTEAQRQALLAQIPVGRFCEPEEFAHCVAFLVSPMSGFITGEILDINGGLHFD